MLYSGESLSYGEKPESGWEYVLVFPAPGKEYIRDSRTLLTHQLERSGLLRVRVLEKLRKAQFSYSQLWVPAAKVILLRLALPFRVLQHHSEALGIKLRLKAGYGGGYLEYTRERAHCFVNDNQEENYFTPAERLKITLQVLGSDADWGAGLDIEQYLSDELIEDAYPTHKKKLRDELKNEVVFARWWDPFFRPNLHSLKDYFGSRVATYFAFQSFFKRILIGVALLSIPVHYLMIWSRSAPHFHHAVRTLYAFIIVFWSAYFLKLWKRRNEILKLQWGTLETETESSLDVRPQFQGRPRAGFYSEGGFVDLRDLGDSTQDAKEEVESNTIIPEPLEQLMETYRNDVDFRIENVQTGNTFNDLPSYPYFSRRIHRERIVISWIVTIVFAVVMISFTFLPQYFNIQITRLFSRYTWGASVPGIVTGSLIFVGERIWMNVYPILAKWENHRTNQSYIDSLIIKRFSFEFVVNFSSLFYIALVKPYTVNQPCEPSIIDGAPDCIQELTGMVSSIVITKATLDQFLELGIPTLIIAVNRILLLGQWSLSRSEGAPEMTRALLGSSGRILDENARAIKEYGLNTFENTVEDYGELVIQYGYIALFSSVFPMTSFVFLLCNMIEGRTDAFKYLFLNNRAPADIASSIGRWKSMIKFTMISGVLLNSILLTITTNNQRMKATHPIICFFVLEHIFYGVTVAIDYVFADVPGRVFRSKARQDFLIARMFNVNYKPQFRHRISTKNESRDRAMHNLFSDLSASGQDSTS